MPRSEARAWASPSDHPGRSTMRTPSGCLPFAHVLSADGRVLREAHQALIPGLPLRVVCECLCGLLTLEPHNGDELTGGLDVPEQLPRKVTPGIGLLMALPVLVQSNNRILLAYLRSVRGNSHKHCRSPLL